MPSETYFPTISASSVTGSRKQLSYSQTPTATLPLPTARTGFKCAASKQAARKTASSALVAFFSFKTEPGRATRRGAEKSHSPSFSMPIALTAA